MTAQPAPRQSRTFTVEVDGIGTFTFRRRTIGDELAILSRYDALVAGIASPSPMLDSLASAVATYRTLAVAWPPGWDPDRVTSMDAIEADAIADLLRIFGALSAREDEFRPPEKRRFQAAREATLEQPDGLVPPQVQPPAD